MPSAGSSLFPIKATNAEILPHDQCVFRRYAIILSPTHPTKSRSLYSRCSTVAEARACSRPSFVDGNESPSRNKYQLVRQTARRRFSKHSPDFCFSLPKLRTWVRFPSPAPVTLFSTNNLAMCRGGKRRQGNRKNRASRVAPKALIFQKFGVLRFVDFSTRKETGLLLVARPSSQNFPQPRFRPTSE